MCSSAPWLRHTASFSSLDAHAITRAPSALPISIAARPTPPAAPRTSSVSPAFNAARSRSAWSEVPYVSTNAAPVTKSIFSGSGSSRFASVFTSSAKAPKVVNAMTRSPGRNRYVEGVRFGVFALRAQLGEQQQRVRIAQDALGHARHRGLQPVRIERAADAHRGEHVAHQHAAIRVGGLGFFDLDFYRCALGIRDAWRGRFGHRAALDIDEHGAAVFLQRVELVLRGKHEALEHEGRISPGTIELGDVHAEAQFGDWYAFFHARLTYAQMIESGLLAALAKLGGVIYLGISLSAYLLQDKLIFQPHTISDIQRSQISARHPNVSDIFLQAADGTRLHGWHFKTRADAPL